MRKRRFDMGDCNDPNWETNMAAWNEKRNRNRAAFGIAIALFGLLWLASLVLKFNFDWDEHWPLILIAIGVFVGIKNNFRSAGWWILILIGAAEEVQMHFYNYSEYIWPAVLVIGGIGLALTKRAPGGRMGKKYKFDSSVSTENNINLDVTFGGRKEVITSKEFKGGTVSVTFGGCELNFMQADIIESPAILDLKVSFGGVEIIVPSHWHIQNEISPSFGNVEDERSIQTGTGGENRKLLILKGTCSFGNVEIKSY